VTTRNTVRQTSITNQMADASTLQNDATTVKSEHNEYAESLADLTIDVKVSRMHMKRQKLASTYGSRMKRCPLTTKMQHVISEMARIKTEQTEQLKKTR
jgi:hypothetical protein